MEAKNDRGTQRKKENRYTLVTNHCVVNVAMHFFNKNVLNRLNINHLRLLMNTPFLHLFVIPNKVHTSNAILHCILTRWDHKKNCFSFNNKVLNFTSEDVSNIMCLPSTGDRVILAHKRDSSSTSSKLRHRYFPNMSIIRKEHLEEAITNALEDKNCPATDVVSLLVLYLFTTVLFPNTGGHVPLHLFKYAEQPEELKKYNWGEAVYELLDIHIPKCALWCQMQDLEKGGYGPVGQKKGKEKKEEEDEVPLPKMAQHMPGCCLALIVWFFELTKFSIARESSGHVPRYLDWYKGISERKERIPFERDLCKIKISQIRKKRKAFDREFERPLKEEGFIAAKYLDHIFDEEKFRSTLNTPKYQMLVKLTPIFMKFGIVPCNFLKKQVGTLNPKIVFFEKTFSKHKFLEQDQIEELCKEVDDLEEDEIVYSSKNSEPKFEETSERNMEVERQQKRKLIFSGPNSKEAKSQEKRSKKRHDKLEGEVEEKDKKARGDEEMAEIDEEQSDEEEEEDEEAESDDDCEESEEDDKSDYGDDDSDDGDENSEDGKKEKEKINDDSHEDIIPDYQVVKKGVEKGKACTGPSERTDTDNEVL